MNLKTLLRVSLAAILALALLAGACGGNEEAAPATPETTADTSFGTPLSTPLPGDAGATLVDLLTRGLNATYKVTYETTSAEGSEGDGYVVFNRPPLTRIDFSPPGLSEASSSIIGGEGLATISCSDGPDQWECFEIPPLGGSLLFTAGPFVSLNHDDLASLDVNETQGRSIAGQAARCFRVSPRRGESGEELDYCLNSDGVPLYSAPLFGNVEATEFSVDVLDEDFTPPAEPQR